MSEAFVVQATVDRPAAEVWDALVDWPNAHKWMSGVDSMHADGPLAVGTELTFHARGKDRPSEIAALEEGRSVTLRSVQGGVTADYRYEVAAESDASTRVMLAAECNTSGVWSLVGPLLRIMMKRTDGGQVDDLKAYVEGGG